MCIRDRCITLPTQTHSVNKNLIATVKYVNDITITDYSISNISHCFRNNISNFRSLHLSSSLGVYNFLKYLSIQNNIFTTYQSEGY